LKLFGGHMDTKVVSNKNVGFQPGKNPKEVDRTLLDEIAKNDKARQAKEEVKGKKLDKSVDVELSPDAKALAEAHAKAFEIAINTPEVNEDRVAELKAKIQNGTYRVNPEGIADGILREAILDKLAEEDA